MNERFVRWVLTRLNNWLLYTANLKAIEAARKLNAAKQLARLSKEDREVSISELSLAHSIREVS